MLGLETCYATGQVRKRQPSSFMVGAGVWGFQTSGCRLRFLSRWLYTEDEFGLWVLGQLQYQKESNLPTADYTWRLELPVEDYSERKQIP